MSGTCCLKTFICQRELHQMLDKKVDVNFINTKHELVLFSMHYGKVFNVKSKKKIL